MTRTLVETGKLVAPAGFEPKPDDIKAVEWCAARVLPFVLDYDAQYELPLDLSDLGIKEPGTGDVVLIGDMHGAHHVIDYKFGRTEVSTPEWNRQLWAYAWGVHHKWGGAVTTQILQPELEVDGSFTFEAERFPAIQAELVEIVKKASDPNAPLCKGDHCYNKFCSARNICPLHRGSLMELPRHLSISQHLRELTPAGRAKLYDTLQTAQKWCKDALEMIEIAATENGLPVEGYTVVPSTGNRKWADEDAIFDTFRSAMDADPALKLLVPVSPAQAEKITGKKWDMDTITPITGKKLKKDAVNKESSDKSQPAAGSKGKKRRTKTA